MGTRRKFSAEYKREAVAMLDAPGVTVSQVAADLGIGANMLGRWRRELRRLPQQAFVGNGRSRDEELSQLRRELARVTKERDFLREAAADSTSECNTTWFRPRWRTSRSGRRWYGTSGTARDDRGAER
jgi:transposase-like protein